MFAIEWAHTQSRKAQRHIKKNKHEKTARNEAETGHVKKGKNWVSESKIIKYGVLFLEINNY